MENIKKYAVVDQHSKKSVLSSKPSESTREITEKHEKAESIREPGVAREAYEAAGLEEGAETGKVSEVSSKRKEGKAATGISGSHDPAQIKAQLLKRIPSEKVMRAQIEKEIKKEIKYLHRRAVKMLRSPGSMSYFEMSNLMKKVRELKGILMALVKMSFDKLKTFWLRFVHGAM